MACVCDINSVLNKYHNFLEKNLIVPDINNEIAHMLYRYAALAEEVGELGGKLKRLLRDSDGELTQEMQKEMADELGDILWNTSQFALLVGFSLEEIIEMNMKKLNKRIGRKTIRGKGDKR